jgi:hypothetical protein
MMMNKYLECFKINWRQEIEDMFMDWENGEGYFNIYYDKLKNDVLDELNQVLIDDYSSGWDLSEIEHLKYVKESGEKYPEDAILNALAQYHFIIDDEEIRFVFNRKSPINSWLVYKMCVTKKSNDWESLIDNMLRSVKNAFVKKIENDNGNYPRYSEWIPYMSRDEIEKEIKDSELPYFEELVDSTTYSYYDWYKEYSLEVMYVQGNLIKQLVGEIKNEKWFNVIMFFNSYVKFCVYARVSSPGYIYCLRL